MSAIKTLKDFCGKQEEKCYGFKNDLPLWDDDTSAISLAIDENDLLCVGCETGNGMLYLEEIKTERDAFYIIKHLIENGEIEIKTNDSV